MSLAFSYRVRGSAPSASSQSASVVTATSLPQAHVAKAMGEAGPPPGLWTCHSQDTAMGRGSECQESHVQDEAHPLGKRRASHRSRQLFRPDSCACLFYAAATADLFRDCQALRPALRTTLEYHSQADCENQSNAVEQIRDPYGSSNERQALDPDAEQK